MKKSNIFLVLLAAAGLLGAIQAFPMSRTNPPVLAEVNAPPEVKAILKASCYDCHSNETAWPWYTKVAPFSWLVARDVSEGRRKLNFSEWNCYDPARQAGLVTHAIREIRRGEMPPWYYTIKHGHAKLSPEQKAVLEAWAAAH